MLCLEAVAEQPSSLGGCDHVFCRGCLLRAMGADRRCPTCRTPAPEARGTPVEALVARTRWAAEQAEELEVHCPHGVRKVGAAWGLREGGCAKVVARGALAKHLQDECLFATVRCGAAELGCAWRGLGRERVVHGAACWYAQSRPFVEQTRRELAAARAEAKQGLLQARTAAAELAAVKAELAALRARGVDALQLGRGVGDGVAAAAAAAARGAVAASGQWETTWSQDYKSAGV